MKAGCVVIDNSSVFRMDPAVAVGGAGNQWRGHQEASGNYCESELHDGDHVDGVVSIARGVWSEADFFASSYQAVSGTGAKAIEELERQVGEVVAGEAGDEGSLSASDRVSNVLPHVDSFLASRVTRRKK